jgi:aspartate-semialdehyde dehydrogenase
MVWCSQPAGKYWGKIYLLDMQRIFARREDIAIVIKNVNLQQIVNKGKDCIC